MKTILDTAADWWLEKANLNTERDILELTLLEYVRESAQASVSNLILTAESRKILVRFAGVLCHLIADDATQPWTESDVRDDGFLHEYARSRLLDYMNREPGKSEFHHYHCTAKHYGVGTASHMVHVIAQEPPVVEHVR